MIEKCSLVSEFLIDKKYRFWRYAFFLLAGGVITSSMVFVAYMDCSSRLGNRIYLLCFSLWMGYAGAMLLHYHFLMPAFLLRGNYTIYSILLLATAYILPSLSILQEYYVRSLWELPHRITSYTSPWIWVDNLSSCILLLICFWGVALAKLFRQWKSQEEQLGRMEQAHLLSEVNKLKGQITPSFLSETLMNATLFVKSDPSKANEVLMQLGRLLRYQLYDCPRDDVLLTSEINHLHIFLRLKQLNKEGFGYEIRTSGDLNVLCIPSLLLISLSQCFAEQSAFLKIHLMRQGNYLFLFLEADRCDFREEKEWKELKKRLDLCYPGKYEFNSRMSLASPTYTDTGTRIEKERESEKIRRSRIATIELKIDIS